MIRFRVRFQTVEKLIEMRMWLFERNMNFEEVSIAAVLVMVFPDPEEAMMFKLAWGEQLEQLQTPR